MHNVFDNWFRGGCRSSESMLPPTPFYKRKSRKSFTFCYRRRVSSALVLSAGTKQICLSRTLRLNKQIIIVESCDYHTISFVALPSVQGTPQILRHNNRRPMSVSNKRRNSCRLGALLTTPVSTWESAGPTIRVRIAAKDSVPAVTNGSGSAPCRRSFAAASRGARAICRLRADRHRTLPRGIDRSHPNELRRRCSRRIVG